MVKAMPKFVAAEGRWPGDAEGRIPMAWPDIGDAERYAAVEALLSGILCDGPEVAALEAEFAARVNAKHAIATASGTAALEASYLAVDVDGRDVITCPLTFHATAESARRAGARVRFADVGGDTYTMSPSSTFRVTTLATAAIVPIHYDGVAVDIEKFLDVAFSCGATVIEDAAHAAGESYPDGTPVGSRAETLCCFSFNAQKPMTTLGMGGMVTTGSDELAERVRMLIRQGMVRRGPERNQQLRGFNGRMGEVNAAVGRVQLRRLPGLRAARKQRARWYLEALAGAVNVELPPWLDDGSCIFFPVKLKRQHKTWAVLDAMSIETAVHYYPVHLQGVWRGHGVAGAGAFPGAEVTSSWTLSLPSHSLMTKEDVLRVASVVREVQA